MYGTVARMRVKPGSELALLEMSESGELDAPGVVFQYIYRLDNHPNEYMIVVGFENKEAYVSNANSPEQHQRFLEYRKLLEADPEWHDGEVIHSSSS
jgi:quinol monooxygenase YgiN